jgi:hypothetical protein
VEPSQRKPWKAFSSGDDGQGHSTEEINEVTNRLDAAIGHG